MAERPRFIRTGPRTAGFLLVSLGVRDGHGARDAGRSFPKHHEIVICDPATRWA
jgi:hypothetical protein